MTEITVDTITSFILNSYNSYLKESDGDHESAAIFAKTVASKKFDNQPAKNKHLDGVYLISGVQYNPKEEQLNINIIWAPKISSIIDSRINIVIDKNGDVVPEEQQ